MHYVHNFRHANLVLWFLCAYYYAVRLWVRSPLAPVEPWCRRPLQLALPPSRHPGMAPPTPQNRPGVWTLLEWVSGYLLMVFMFLFPWKLEVSARISGNIDFASWDSRQDMMFPLFTLVQTKIPSSLSESQVFNLAGHFEHLILLMDKVVCHLPLAKRIKTMCITRILSYFVHLFGGFEITPQSSRI